MAEKSKTEKSAKKKMPDTVRTAGAEDVRETDRGTVVEKPKKKAGETDSKSDTPVKKKKIPDTVRTAGEDDIQDTDD